MATSRDSSNGPDLIDVLAVLEAFEEMNHVRLLVNLSVVREGKSATLQVVSTAYTSPIVDVVPVRLVSRQSMIGYADRRRIEQVILNDLYGLDADLARVELEGAPQK